MSDTYAAEQEQAAPQEAPTPRDAGYWHDRLKEYDRAVEDKWKDQRKNLDRLYSRDERADTADREYSIFWANIEVLRPAVYARPPIPVVAPRFKQSDKLASSASDLLERCLVTTFEQADVDGCMREVRDEFLRYSRGSARVRLDQNKDGSEKLVFDHFTASDFKHDPARTWREVKWVAFRAWLTKADLEKRFKAGMEAMGLDIAQVPIKKREGQAEGDKKEDQAPVWEIWCRTTGKVHFVAEEFDSELDTQDPWLDLSSFWPCPRPVFATLVPGTLKPVPDIRQYKDQIEEINEYTARIAALSEALKVKGFYPAGAGELSEAIEAALKSIDNRATLVPVSSAAALGGTGFKEAIVWLPVTDILAIIQGLVELRRVVIDDVYQITGISDIQRGDSDPNETLGAQQLKSQWGAGRIRERQNELVRFARDLTRISAEVIAENFSPQTMLAMAQLKLPTQMERQQAMMALQSPQPMVPGQPPAPPPQPSPEQMKALESPTVEEVMAFLRDDKARGFVIEIETDSTIQPDEDAEKQRRTEFVTAVGGLIAQAAPLIEKAPQLGPFVGAVLKFTAQGFRAGRALEGEIDSLVELLSAHAEQAQGPKPDPKAEADAAAAKAKVEGAQAQTQATVTRAQADMAQTQMDMQASTLEHQQTMQELQATAMFQPAPNQGPFQ